MKKRLVTAALLALSLLLTSCSVIQINYGNDTTDPYVGTEPPESVTDEYVVPNTREPVSAPDYSVIDPPDYRELARAYLAALPERDMDGISVFIAASDTSLFEPEETADEVDAAVYARNDLVAEKYDTAILTLKATSDELFTDAYAAHLAGQYYADLIAIPLTSLGVFQVRSFLLNLRSLPFVDFTADYFDSEAMEQLSAGYDTFGAVGEANKSVKNLACVLFNKDIAGELTGTSLYRDAYSGTWTWDKLIAYAREAVESGYFGCTSDFDAQTLIDVMFDSSGEYYLDTGFGVTPVTSYYGTRTVSLADMIHDFLNDGSYMSAPEEGLARTAETFCAGKALFRLTKGGSVTDFAENSINWGALPMPKFDEEQEGYSSYTDQNSTVLVTLSSNANIESTGLILQALNAASYGYIRQAYYDILTETVICDTDTLSMLELVYGGAKYDFMYMFGGPYQTSYKGTVLAFHNAVEGKNTLKYYYNYYNASVKKQLNSYFKTN